MFVKEYRALLSHHVDMCRVPTHLPCSFLGYVPDSTILPAGVEFSTQYRQVETEREELEGLRCAGMAALFACVC